MSLSGKRSMLEMSNGKRYTEEHEWVELNENIATVGVSNHAADELGEIVFVELPTLGTEIGQMDEVGTIESVKTVSSLYSPLTGKIVEVNTELENQPNLVNESANDEGWIFKVEIEDSAEVEDLMTEDEYNTYLETL